MEGLLDKGFSDSKGSVACSCLSCGTLFFRTAKEIAYVMDDSRNRFTEKFWDKQIEKGTLEEIKPENQAEAGSILTYFCDFCIYRWNFFNERVSIEE